MPASTLSPLSQPHPLVLIKGAGDLASGVALRLHRSGFHVVMTELTQPLAVRRAVSFAQAVFDGECVVEEVRARRCDPAQVEQLLAQNVISILVEPTPQQLIRLGAVVLVDAIMAKRNTGTTPGDAPVVVALGPGFSAGVDCHAVIETNRGHNLGRVIWNGGAEPDTGQPGEVTGMGAQATRVLRAPAAGFVHAHCAIGDRVAAGEPVASLHGDEGATPITAPFAGVLRGVIHSSVRVWPGMKIGDLDPRARREYCFTVSDKALAIAGGVLEAILQRGVYPAMSISSHLSQKQHELRIFPVSDIPLVRPGDDLAALIVEKLTGMNERLVDGDILVIAQKVVSKAEGRLIRLADVTPSAEAVRIAEIVGKDARAIQVVLNQTRAVLRVRRGLLVVEDEHGWVCANAGVDRSNVQAADDSDVLALLPGDADVSAAALRARLHALTGVAPAVIINDSHGRAWRIGTLGVCIGCAGLPPVWDQRGLNDLFGYTLQASEECIADELAAAASLVMGQSDEGRPVVVIRGYRLPPVPHAPARAIQRPPEMDVFR